MNTKRNITTIVSLLAVVLSVSFASARQTSQGWAKPPELLKKEAEFQQKKDKLNDYKKWLGWLKKREEDIKELETALNGYKYKLYKQERANRRSLWDDYYQKHKNYMDHIKVRKVSWGGYWTEYEREANRLSLDRREPEELKWWCNWDCRESGMYSGKLLNEEKDLNEARRKYWQARDIIDRQIYQNRELYIPGAEVEIGDLDTLEKVVTRYRTQFDKTSVLRIKQLEGPDGRGGEIARLQKEADELKSVITEWNTTRRRPGDTDRSTTVSRTIIQPPESAPKQPRVTCQVVEVANPRETKPGAYRWTFYLLFTETNDVPCHVELVRRTRWPRPLQAERDDAKWRHIDFFLTSYGSGPHKRKIGPESLTLSEDLKFKGSYEAVFRIIYDERRKQLPEPIVVKWYPKNLPRLTDTQPTQTVVLTGGLSPKLLNNYNKVDTDPDPEAVNYRTTFRGTPATVTLRPDGTAKFSGVKVVYYNREVKKDNGREITVTIQPGRGKISGDSIIGKTTGTYVERVWIREPYRGQKRADKTHPPVTKSVGWGAYKQRDGTYILSIRSPKRLINTYDLKFVLTSGSSRH